MAKHMVRSRLVGLQKNVLGKEKRLRKGNVTMGSVGHMRGLQCGTRLMVQWVLGIVGGDHAKVGEGRAGAVDVGGPAVYGK